VRDFFGSLRFKIFIGIALVLIGLIMRTAVTGGFSTLPENVMNTVVSPLQTLSASISNGVSDFFSGIVSSGSMKKENAQLKNQITDLNKKLVDYNEIKNENDQYKAFLGIKEDNTDYVFCPAMVISRPAEQWFYTFTIDKGRANGIKVDDPAITAEGLVGKVSQVSENSSVVTTILDPSLQVGTIISQTNDIGITQGDQELATKGLLRINHITKDSTISVGDLAITYGVGGIYPNKLIIGTISEIKADPNGNSLYAVLKPMVDPTSVKDVFIITSFKGMGDQNTGDVSSSASTTSSAASSSSGVSK
jgi:rod shape-determining protein MreC